MSTDLSKAVGYATPDKDVSWNKRDLLTYAVGVGAKADDFPFVYELDSNFSALPTYPVVLPLKQDGQDVNLFKERASGIGGVPGMPKLDPNRMLHGSQSIEILKKLPLVSGPGWKWKSRYTGVSENKSGIVLMLENTLVDSQGVPYAKLYSSTFNLGAKATGQPFSEENPPTRAGLDHQGPDEPEQAIIFRLSGDYNPLHIDPTIGKSAGFGGVILHGLSTFGFAARGLIKEVGGNDPDALKFFGVRFTSPVKPGDGLETRVWEVGTRNDGTVEVCFETKSLGSGKVSLGGGIAYIKKGRSKAAKL
ncbi:hypothetical protein BDZ89DRAFT_1130577 [Hymenopellis radicata]|nr:hypothetical protein BDZ89DRAFT_1130577 [Hymenopellis radicata]